MQFVPWYNHEHRHNGIRYVTPAQRYAGWDRRLLKARHAVYQSARERNPRRWSGNTRNWTLISVVTLNPERDTYIQVAGSQIEPVRLGSLLSRFPVPTWQRPSHGAQRRRREARSHPQRISLREHGEHRTFSTVSTVAHSPHAGDPLRRTPKSTAQRLRRWTCRYQI